MRLARALRGTKNGALSRWASPTRITGRARRRGENPETVHSFWTRRRPGRWVGGDRVRDKTAKKREE